MNPRKTHAALLDLLQDRERGGQLVTFNEIVGVTGWKPISLETYLKKGQLSEYLNETSPGAYAVSNTIGLLPLTFSRNLSQSKNRRELGFNCHSGLARALLHKARDNMMLALELYNRPSLENRLDAFVLCFCVAWEHLLKAILIERDGEPSIFRAHVNAAGIRETISLRECLDRHFKKNTAVRRNIERIAFYRDQAIHLLMPEAQGLMSRAFQSGVMNFGKAFSDFAEQPVIQAGAAGLLSLVGDLSTAPDATILSKSGAAAGQEILEILRALEAEAQAEDDIEFAIPLSVKLVFAKTDTEGNSITLSKAEAGIEGLAKAIVIEKPVDGSRTHPFRTNDVIREINQRIAKRYDTEHLKKYLECGDAKGGKTTISEFDFRVIATKLAWRASNNVHHYLHENPETHYYSEKAVDDFIERIFSQPGYLAQARAGHKK
jgi:hypothetical protein